MTNDIVKVDQLTVENTEHYTVLKLLHKLIDKINELVYANGDIYDKLDYLLNDGLSQEVVKALTEWLNDGTLSDIITEQVLVEIDSRLDALEEMQNKTNEELSLVSSEVEYVFPRNYGGIDSGDFCLIKAYNKNILVDTYRSDVWSDFKRDLNIERVYHLDYIIVTHYHMDHASNFVNLVNDGFIDQNTVVIIPKYSEKYIGTNPVNLSYYYQIRDACKDNNLNWHYPVEDEEIIIENFKLQIFNTDPSYYESITDNYNACSLVQLISHGDIRVFLSGDAQPETFQYLMNHVDMPKLDLYKVEHHGINNYTYYPFLEKIHPTYSVQPIGLRDYSSKLLASRSLTNLWLNDHGCINYGTGVSTKLVKFRSTMNDLKVIQGTPFNANKNVCYGGTTIYVDSSVSDSVIPDGTAEKPFRHLAQAVAQIDSHNYGTININVANGTYNGPSYYVNVSRLYNIPADITITGNTADPSQVILADGFDILNCPNVAINGFTIYTDNSRAISGFGCNLKVDNVVLTTSDDTITERAGIFIKNSTLVMANSTIKNCSTGLQAKYSTINLNTNRFTNNTQNISLEATNYSIKNMDIDNYNNALSRTITSQPLNKPFASFSINDYTTTTTNTETLGITQEIVSDGSCFNVEADGILINYGINYIAVSGAICLNGGSQPGDLVVFSVWRNGTRISEIQHRIATGTGQESIVLPQTLIWVSSGDKISVRIRSYSRSGVIVLGGSSNSNFTFTVMR